MNPLVSIIMNCKNGEKFLKESLDSVISQTYKNWELIFWDNISTDDSKNLFQSYKHKRFKYFLSNKLTNLSTARNLAISKSKGELITFLDVDDMWSQNKLEEQVNFYNKYKYDLIYSNYYVLNQNNMKKVIYKKKYLPSGKITNYLLKDYNVGILTIMISSKVMKLYNFDERYSIIGDFDLVLRVSKEFNIGYINKILATYRKHLLNNSIINYDKQINELNEWYQYNKLNLCYTKYSNFIKFVDKINYLNFLSYYNENEYSKMFNIFLKQIGIFYKIKMVAFLFLPKMIINFFRK